MKRHDYHQYGFILVIGTVMVLGGLMWAVIRIKTVDPTTAFVASLKVPYAPLVPSHLPAGATLGKNSGQSSYDAGTHVLTLRWTYRAQTLPGQGTLILYQANTTAAFSVPVDIDQTVQVKGIDAALGHLHKADNVPTTPGERTLSLVLNDRQIVLVSYAISDEELVTIANSLR